MTLQRYGFLAGLLFVLCMTALGVWLSRTSPSEAQQPDDFIFADIDNPSKGINWHSFDFKDGRRYPAPVTVDLLDGALAPRARIARVIVALSGPTANTVVAHVTCRNSQEGQLIEGKRQVVIFRPGDPLQRSVACPIAPARRGEAFKFVQSHVPDGAKRGRAAAFARVTSKTAATPLLSEGFRPPHTFNPVGTLVYDVGGGDIVFSDKGGKGAWATRLSHGRTQPGNSETGFYGPISMGGFVQTKTQLMLETRRLEQARRVKREETDYPFLAAALSGHANPQLHFNYGSIEWIVKMPDRKGSWPALWLLPTTGWPPEIDIYEGFGHNKEWSLNSDLSSNVHGGQNNKRSFTRLIFRTKMSDFELPNTLTEEFHRFQATIDEEWISIFVDGQETAQYRNPFLGITWYPIMNVAVKAARKSDYASGSGTMTVASVKIWKRS